MPYATTACFGGILHAELPAVLDFTKELPEDAELDLSDIPGITPSARESF